LSTSEIVSIARIFTGSTEGLGKWRLSTYRARLQDRRPPVRQRNSRGV
jgi:hypothetical protein